MILDIFVLIIGFAALGLGADRFVWGASAIASHYGVRPAIIGLTIVSLGTSAPEIFVSLDAAIKGSQGIAIGNVLGSNIANIGLVLGIAALTSPMLIKPSLYKYELVFLVFFTLLVGFLLHSLYWGQLDGIILLLALVVFLGWLLWSSFNLKETRVIEEEFQKEIPKKVKPLYAWLGFIVGLGLMLVSSNYLVDAAIRSAKHFGVSDWIIGLTVIALGTSLPEVAASIAGVLKKEYDIVLGNVIGSNIFNFLAVLPIAGILVPHPIQKIILERDFSFVAGFTAILAILIFRKSKTVTIKRWQGALLLVGYLGYISYLVF